MFTWVKGNAYTMNVTLYATNMTLNSAAASCFEDVRWVMIGVDKEAMKVAIRPVTKREVDAKFIAMDQLHKISIGKGYGRITNKATMNEIAQMLGVHLNGVKKEAVFNESEGMLVVDLHSDGR